MFDISSRMAIALSIPATYATAFGFIYPYGALLNAMAESRLLPNTFNTVCYDRKLLGLVFGSVIAYAVCVLMQYFPWVSGTKMFNLCMLFGFTAYIAQCVGYIHLKLVFPNLTRHYMSPMGIVGAGFAMLYYFLAMISVLGFQDDDGFAIIVYVMLFILVSAYYFGHSRYTQVLSDDEKAMLYFAKERYLLSVGHNIRKRKFDFYMLVLICN